MKKFFDVLLISVLIVLMIVAGKLFIRVNTELEKQLEANDLTTEESIGSTERDLEQDYAADANIDKEEIALSSNSGQAYEEKSSFVDEINEARQEQLKRREALKNDFSKVKEIQEDIAISILKQDHNLDNRGRIDRRQQFKSAVAGINTLSDSTVELLDWWDSVDELFEKNTPVTVTDVETGKSFKAVRTYGSNHADVETITAEDTAIMKEIWGGEWNWERRAVIVKINGRRLAASASGMPHAGLDNLPEDEWVDNRSEGYGAGANLDMIKLNDMDGHFDIHFLNSRTHRTDKIDELHQQMVEKAFKGVNE